MSVLEPLAILLAIIFGLFILYYIIRISFTAIFRSWFEQKQKFKETEEVKDETNIGTK